MRACKPESARRLYRRSTLLLFLGKSGRKLTPVSSIRDSPSWKSGRDPACWRCGDGVSAGIWCRSLPGCEGLNAIANTIRVVAVSEDVIYVVDDMIVCLGPDREIFYRHVGRKCQVIRYKVQRRPLYSVCDGAYLIISIRDFIEGNY